MASLSIRCVHELANGQKFHLSQRLMTAPRAFMILSSTPAGQFYSFWPCLALQGATPFPASSSTTHRIAL